MVVWGEWLQVPFERAAAHGEVHVATVLLKAGAKGNGVASAARNGHRRVISELLQHGASVASKDRRVVRTLLIEGADPDSFDSNGRTPLYLACLLGKVAVARALLAAGAHVSRVVKEPKDAPLDAAATEGHAEVMRLLVERGAVEPAVDALAGADMSAVAYLCVERDSFAALDIASLYGNASMMKTLLKHGADPNTRSWRNLTALQKAAEGNEAEAIDVLIKSRRRHFRAG
ncbi:unnamed protein product [Ectocarpus sp. CCAP 1310/34]|nr:unnamed protein product [Ectocarpus sp. CCAP 1310/34]